MIKKIILTILKPENPIDLDIYTQLPREKYNLQDRLKVFLLAIMSLDKNFFYFFLVIMRHLLIRILLFIFFPFVILFNFLKFKFVVINYWQVGTSLRHLTNLNKYITLKKDNYKYLVYFPKAYPQSNIIKKAFNKNLIFIENSFLCILLYLFFHSEILRFKIVMFDEHYQKSLSYYLNYLFKKKKYKLEFFNKQDKLKFKKKIKQKYNLKLTDKVVTINVRNKNYYKTSTSLRDAEITNYEKSVNYLVRKNYKVFHFGNSDNEKLKNLINKKNYFFLNVKNKNFDRNLQFYLISISKFFICTNSGPYVFGCELNVPILLTNLHPYHGLFSYNQRDISIPKLVKFKNKPVKFKKILGSSLCFRVPKNKKFKVIENTPNEILNGVLEIEKKIYKKNLEISFFNSKILDEYHPNRYGVGSISKNFIKNHKRYFK